MKEHSAQIHVSSLTSKFQATVPLSVRKILGLKQKDRIAFVVDKGGVSLRKATPLDLEYLRSLEGTLEEWNSSNDENAYRDL